MMKAVLYMLLRQCSICRRKIPMSEKCECEIESNRLKKNDDQKSYYDKNKESLKMIKSARWGKIRKLIIQRDGGYCQRCFIKYKVFTEDNLQVHHIKPRIDYPELVYDNTNLVTLCKRCNLELGTNPSLDFEFEAKDIGFNI